MTFIKILDHWKFSRKTFQAPLFSYGDSNLEKLTNSLGYSSSLKKNNKKMTFAFENNHFVRTSEVAKQVNFLMASSEQVYDIYFEGWPSGIFNIFDSTWSADLSFYKKKRLKIFSKVWLTLPHRIYDFLTALRGISVKLTGWRKSFEGLSPTQPNLVFCFLKK